MTNEIFLVLEEFITGSVDKEAYGAILAAGQAQYREKNYDDPDPAQLLDIVLTLAAKKVDLVRRRLEYDLGRFAVPYLALRYHSAFEGANHPRDLLNALASLHQPGTRGYCHSSAPTRFLLLEQGVNKMTLSCEAAFFPCFFAKGLIVGMGEYCGINTRVKQIDCQRNKNRYSLFFIEFSA